MTISLKQGALFVVASSIFAHCVVAEKRRVDLFMPPTAEYFHYAEGLVRGPGMVSVSGLTFTAVSKAGGFPYDDFGDDGYGEDDKVMTATKEDVDVNANGRNSDGGMDNGGTVLDVAFLLLPRKCSRSVNGCDWTQLGVGAKMEDDSQRWCCTQETIKKGFCTKEQKGRLIVDDSKFTGALDYISVPEEGPFSQQLDGRVFVARDTGTYAVAYANCNVKGREILVSGVIRFRSKHGSLPGQLWGEMFFFQMSSVVYFVLFCWYAYSMSVNKESRIPIEKFIFATIFLGLLEMLSKTTDFEIWNVRGDREDAMAYVSVIVGVLKQGISRCLIVMVALGWGVTRDDLGPTLKKVIAFGTIYCVAAMAVEVMITVVVEEVQTMSYEEEIKIFDAVTGLTLGLVAIDVVFAIWILNSLNQTMTYLENNKQSRKMERYLRLRHIFLLSILFAIIRLVFTSVNNYNEVGIVREEHQWVIEAAEESNYMFVLIAVAILWRPCPNAKEYSYVMELPSGGENGDFEFTSVPCAADLDDDTFFDAKDCDDDDECNNEYGIDDSCDVPMGNDGVGDISMRSQ